MSLRIKPVLFILRQTWLLLDILLLIGLIQHIFRVFFCQIPCHHLGYHCIHSVFFSECTTLIWNSLCSCVHLFSIWYVVMKFIHTKQDEITIYRGYYLLHMSTVKYCIGDVFHVFSHSPPHIALWIYTIENDMICPCGQKCAIEIEMQVIQSCPGCWKLIFIKYMRRICCDITTSSVKGQLWFVIVYHERYSTFCIVVQTFLSRLKRTLSGSYEIFNESSVCSWRETQWSENSTGISLRKCITWMQ